MIEKPFCWKALIQHLKTVLWFNLHLRLEICPEQRKNSTKRSLQSFQKIKWKFLKQNFLLQFKNKMNQWKEATSRKKLSQTITTYNLLITQILHIQNLDSGLIQLSMASEYIKWMKMSNNFAYLCFLPKKFFLNFQDLLDNILHLMNFLSILMYFCLTMW